MDMEQERLSSVKIADKQFRDVESFVAGGNDWGLDFIQLDAGVLDASCKLYAGRSVVIQHLSFNRKFHQRGTPPPGVVSFGVLDDPGTHIAYGETFERNTMLRFNTPDGLDVIAGAGFAAFPVMLDENYLFEVAEQLGVALSPKDLAGAPYIHRNRIKAVASLRRELHKLFQIIRSHSDWLNSPAMVADIESTIAANLLAIVAQTGVGGQVAPRCLTRFRGLRRAVNYIREHEAEVISLPALSREANVSWRTLDRAFREHFGVTPKQYIKRLQLTRVQKSLQRAEPGTNIMELASRWGFYHQGHFARAYKAHFGELPSQTLQAAQK